MLIYDAKITNGKGQISKPDIIGTNAMENIKNLKENSQDGVGRGLGGLKHLCRFEG